MSEIDYEVGDQIVCVEDGPPDPDTPFIPNRGDVFLCVNIISLPFRCGCGGTLGTEIEGHPETMYCASGFRKVQKLDVGAWLRANKPVPVPKELEPA